MTNTIYFDEKVSTHPGYPYHYSYEKASTHPGHSGSLLFATASRTYERCGVCMKLFHRHSGMDNPDVLKLSV
jgi:hypothetical protein